MCVCVWWGRGGGGGGGGTVCTKPSIPFPSSLHSTQLKTHVNPLTGCIAPYTPMGRFIHVPPPCPRSDWANNFGKPWWKNEKYCNGVLSSKTRRIRIINTLTLQEQIVEVWNNESCNYILHQMYCDTST